MERVSPMINAILFMNACNEWKGRMIDEYVSQIDHHNSFTMRPESYIDFTRYAPKEAVRRSMIAFPMGREPQM